MRDEVAQCSGFDARGKRAFVFFWSLRISVFDPKVGMCLANQQTQQSQVDSFDPAGAIKAHTHPHAPFPPLSTTLSVRAGPRLPPIGAVPCVAPPPPAAKRRLGVTVSSTLRQKTKKTFGDEKV
jgi:hypothetical protein